MINFLSSHISAQVWQLILYPCLYMSSRVCTAKILNILQDRKDKKIFDILLKREEGEKVNARRLPLRSSVLANR